MIKRLTISIAILVIALLSAINATLAWFDTESAPVDNRINSGGIELSKPLAAYDSISWKSGQSKRVSYSFTNTGSRAVYIRVKPKVLIGGELQSNYVTYTLDSSGQGSWIEGEDGWWYYGNTSTPTVSATGDSLNITLNYQANLAYQGEVTLYLEAEALQDSFNALGQIWVESPWN